MTTNAINANSLEKEKLVEKEERKVRVRFVLLICSFSKNTGQAQCAEAFRNRSSFKKEEKNEPIGNYLVGRTPYITDTEEDEADTDVKTECLYCEETNKNEYPMLSKKIDQIVEKYCAMYSSVIINFLIPTDNECAVMSGLFFDLFCPKCIDGTGVFHKVDQKKSSISVFYLI